MTEVDPSQSQGEVKTEENAPINVKVCPFLAKTSLFAYRYVDLYADDIDIPFSLRPAHTYTYTYARARVRRSSVRQGMKSFSKSSEIQN